MYFFDQEPKDASHWKHNINVSLLSFTTQSYLDELIL